MAGIKVNAQIVVGERGKNDIRLELTPEGAPLTVSWLLDPQSARNVSQLLLDVAKKAEQVIILPTFDSVPPIKA